MFPGELGSHFYVSAEGEYEVVKDGKVLGRLGVGKAFGELAILYNCKRTASIKVELKNRKNFLISLLFFVIFSGSDRWEAVVHGKAGVPADHAEHWDQEDGEPSQLPQERPPPLHLPP